MHGGEPHPEHPRPELADELGRRLDRQSRLSRAAGTGQRHEPSAVAQQSGDFTDLPLTADERTHRPRQVGVRDRLQRREALVSELEDRHRLAEILQPMLAEVCDGDPADELLGRMREQHLAAVRRAHDPRRQVDVVADVLRRIEQRLARCAGPFGTRTGPVDSSPAHLVRRRRPPRASEKAKKNASPS